MPDGSRLPLSLFVDGREVEVADDGQTLLSVLREQLRIMSVKDGCSPQGQCGCCTVLVDGAPRVSCVTPAKRVAGRQITTLDGLDPAAIGDWADAFCATGASQCGFCTPGIVVRLEALRQARADAGHDQVERALLAHLCRCTGWRTILDAWDEVRAPTAVAAPARRNLDAAARRATIEGHSPQRVAPEIALGRAGFADDTAPVDALVAVPDGAGGWAVGETLDTARAASGKVQGRRTTVEARPPLELPAGEWDLTLRTSWVEPAYLELDASWCEPGGEPATPLANGGAFGGKVTSIAAAAARMLADEHDRPVRVVLSREDAVRLGPKRPPIAAGLRSDGTGIVRVVRTPGVADAIRALSPAVDVDEVAVAGPPTSLALRAAGWAEAAVLLAGLRAWNGETGPAEVAAPTGARASAEAVDGVLHVSVACGAPLDDVVLRSYCVGAAHMALGWVTSEGLAVDADGQIHDLTIRSFGVLRAIDTPPVEVTIESSGGEPVNGSDAVFAAVAAATWVAAGLPPDWPTGGSLRS